MVASISQNKERNWLLEVKMGENTVLLNTLILVGCYLFVTITLMVATIWIYRLKVKIRELERKV